MVTKRGSEAAVLVPVDEWRCLKAAAQPSLKQLLRSELRQPKPQGAVQAGLGALEDMQLHLSAVTIGEIQAVIAPTRDQGPAKASDIRRGWNWLPVPTTCFR